MKDSDGQELSLLGGLRSKNKSKKWEAFTEVRNPIFAYTFYEHPNYVIASANWEKMVNFLKTYPVHELTSEQAACLLTFIYFNIYEHLKLVRSFQQLQEDDVNVRSKNLIQLLINKIGLHFTTNWILSWHDMPEDLGNEIILSVKKACQTVIADYREHYPESGSTNIRSHRTKAHLAMNELEGELKELTNLFRIYNLFKVIAQKSRSEIGCKAWQIFHHISCLGMDGSREIIGGVSPIGIGDHWQLFKPEKPEVVNQNSSTRFTNEA